MLSLPNTGFQPQLAEWDIVGWLCEAIYGAMSTMLANSIDLIVGATDPDLSVNSFTSQFALMKTVGLWVLVPLVMISTIMAVLRGSVKDLLQTYLVAVPAVIIGMPVSVMLVRLLQAIDQNLTEFVMSSSQNEANGFLNRLGDTSAVIGENPDIGTLVVLAIGALVVFIALFFLLFEFAFRAVMLSVGVVFLPLALGAAVWPPARRFLVTLVETVIILVFSKFIAIATFYFGLAMAFGSLQNSGWDYVEAIIVAGLVTVFAACALPVLLGFVFGQGPNTNVGSREVINQSPLSLSTGRSDVRRMAVDGIKKRGKDSVTP